MKALALVLCVCVAGCTAAELTARDDAQCRQLGAAPGTPVYTDCMLRKEQMRNDTRNALLMSR